MTVYETERLVVRQWTDADVDRVYDIYSRWEVARWLGARPRALSSRDQAATAVRRWRQSNTDRYGLWAVQVRDSGLVAGAVLLKPMPDADTVATDDVEVGWHVHPDSWGRGYATEAARGAVAKGFADGLAEVYAVRTKPGGKTPSSGQYRPAGSSGKPVKGSTEVTGVEGKRMPPTPKRGQTWVNVDKTKHKK